MKRGKKMSNDNYTVLENLYDKYVTPCLNELDSGASFKKWTYRLLQLYAWYWLIYGAYTVLMGLFGDAGYFSGGASAMGVLGSLVSIAMSLFTVWYVYSIVNNRAGKLNGAEYTGVTYYVFGSVVPASGIILGEVSALILIATGAIGLLGTLLNTTVYAPVGAFYGAWDCMLTYFVQYIPMWNSDAYTNNLAASTLGGSYSNFWSDIWLHLGFMLGGGYLLTAYYVAVEVYKYLYKLAVAVLNWIPEISLRFTIKQK